MPEFFDFDPVTGIKDEWDYDEQTGTAVIHRSQDVSAILKATAEARNTGSCQKGIKRDDYFVLHAMIPTIVEMDLLKRGIDIMNPHDHKRMMAVIESDYPMLKTTEMHG